MSPIGGRHYLVRMRFLPRPITQSLCNVSHVCEMSFWIGRDGELELSHRDDPVLDLLIERGLLHEQAYTDHLRDQGRDVTEIRERRAVLITSRGDWRFHYPNTLPRRMTSLSLLACSYAFTAEMYSDFAESFQSWLSGGERNVQLLSGPFMSQRRVER